jgi:hypothetical protein
VKGLGGGCGTDLVEVAAHSGFPSAAAGGQSAVAIITFVSNVFLLATIAVGTVRYQSAEVFKRRGPTWANGNRVEALMPGL